VVRASALEPGAVIEAMHRGEFYASSGVTLASVTFDPEARVLEIAVEAGGDGVGYTTEFIGTRKGVDLTPEPFAAPEDDAYAERTRYAEGIGVTLATVEGTRARYPLTGDELYVRAVVTSSRPHPNPSFEAQHEQAWTQPVGWAIPVR
jgi:hypothetical protein